MTHEPMDVERARRLADSLGDPNSEEWATYADELQAQGDPRGRLIALHLRAHGVLEDDERERLEAEYEGLLAQHRERWLPDWFEEEDIEGDDAIAIDTVHGYFQAFLAIADNASAGIGPRVRRTLTCPAAWPLREVYIACTGPELPEIVDGLLDGPDHLRKLDLEVTAEPEDPPSWTISGSRRKALERKLATLKELGLDGRQIVDNLDLPQLEELVLRGYDVIAGWGRTTTLPRLSRLEIDAFGNSHDTWQQVNGELVERLAVPELLPSLRSLDLSDNPPCRRGSMNEELYGWILSAPILAQLDELILPPPPTAAIAQRLLEADGLRGIGRVYLPRSQFTLGFDEITRSGIALEIGDIYPFRFTQQLGALDRLWFTVGDEPAFALRLYWVASLIENIHGSLSGSARATVDALLEGLAALQPIDRDAPGPNLAASRLVYPHAELAAIFAECRALNTTAGVGLEQLFEALDADYPRDTPVTIEYEPRDLMFDPQQEEG